MNLIILGYHNFCVAMVLRHHKMNLMTMSVNQAHGFYANTLSKYHNIILIFRISFYGTPTHACHLAYLCRPIDQYVSLTENINQISSDAQIKKNLQHDYLHKLVNKHLTRIFRSFSPMNRRQKQKDRT